MSAAVTVQPFPWNSLETTARAEVTALQDMRRWVAEIVRIDAFGRALTEIVGKEVQLLGVRSARLARAGAGAFDGGLCVALTAGDGDGARGVLEVEPALAAALLAPMLKRPPLGLANVTASPSAAMAGALAAVVVAAARRAHTNGGVLRVLSAGAASVVEASIPPVSETVALSLTVLVGDDAFAARLLFQKHVFAPSRPEWTARRLASLGETPLSLPIVSCATAASVADVGALRPGDAWLPGNWPLDLARTPAGAWSLHGPVLLAAPSAAWGIRARLVEGGRLVLSGEVDAVCGEADMTEPEGESTVLDAVGDVPVVVRVEIGEARMAARDWASLGRGDVITVGRRVGELVLLRVGGVAVARGELVNVDGEVGVRIAERLAGDPTRA